MRIGDLAAGIVAEIHGKHRRVWTMAERRAHALAVFVIAHNPSRWSGMSIFIRRRIAHHIMHRERMPHAA